MSESIVQLKLNKFRFRSKIAAFDYDFTLVKPKSGGTFPKNEGDWEWLRSSVPITLQKLYNQGYAIVVFTNQTKKWKIAQIETALSTLNIPVLVLIAMDKAVHKPSTAMFDTYLKNDKIKFNMSFFVGDALGRVNDWSNTDKLFGEAIGFQIKTPEEMFPFDVIVHPPVEKVRAQEIVVMIGYPASGKTTYTRTLGKNYVILHGDELKTSAKMIAAAKQPVIDGKSVVFDATNPSKAKRKEYIDFAKKFNIPVRAVHITTSMEECLIRNNQVERMLPKIVYYVFKKKFEEPSLDEGFYEITTI